MKKILRLASLMLLVSLLLLPQAVFGTTYYVLDPVTGQPVDSETDSTATAVDGYVSLVSGISYDVQNDMYSFDISGGKHAISCSVMKGMVTTEPVTVDVAEGVSAILFRNGSEYTEEDLSSVSKTGDYNLNVLIDGISTPVLSFTIAGKVCGTVDSYSLPDTFVVDGVYLDGSLIQSDGISVDFSQEGSYTVEYHNYITNIPYTLTLDIDHTPPVLALAAVGEDSIAHGPVDISDVEDGASIGITCNDEVLSYSSVLKEPGNYYILVQDAAGNTSTYAFTIQVYFNTSSIVFFGIVIILAVLLVIYILRSHNKTRVR